MQVPFAGSASLFIILCLSASLSSCGDNGPSKGAGAGTLEAGQPCQSHDACKSGYCVNIYGSRQCAARCSSPGACGENLQCKRAEARNPDAPGICVGVSTRLCGICEYDLDCGAAGDMCIHEGDSGYCASDCSYTNSCPAGYVCQQVTDQGATGMQCLPEAGSCGCDASNYGVSRECQVSNAYGTCDGEQTCMGDSGWSECDAPEPQQETCDGMDNDCDDMVDEDATGSTLTQECTIPEDPSWNVLPECQGYRYCQGLHYGECTLERNDHEYTASTLPTEEQNCNGYDDDCDGEVDEGLLGTGAHCSQCGDTCHPPDAEEIHVVSRCDTAASPPQCLPPLCQFPWFDVDDDLLPVPPAGTTYQGNGCEVQDDTVMIDSEQRLNNHPDRARSLGWNSGRAHFCNGQLPVDDEAYHDHQDLQDLENAPMAMDFYTVTFDSNPDDIDLHLWVDVPAGSSELATIYACNSVDGLDCSDFWVISASSPYKIITRWFNAGEETVTLQFFANPNFGGFPWPYHFELVERDGIEDTSPNDYCH